MPTISAVPFTTVPAVRVLINWADTPGATHATVFRIDCETGEEQQLRPYIAFNDDGFERLSCGQAVFWDTEMPFDRCIRYCTRAQTALGAVVTAPTVLIQDSFTRNVAAGGWGTPDIGPAYAPVSTPLDFSVNGNFGRISLNLAGARRAIATAPVAVNMLVEGTVFPTVIPVGGTLDQGLLAQYVTSTDTGYEALVRFNSSGVMDARINRINSGSATVLNTTGSIGTQTSSGLGMRIKFLTWGNQLKFKAWDVTLPEPAAWNIEITDLAPLTAAGGAGGVVRAQAGLTLPITASWDNLLVTDPCTTLAVVQSCSDDLMVGSSGWSMLRDPMRPCNDVRVGQCWTPEPNCLPGLGVFFARLETEAYAANSVNQQAFNAARPSTASRQRSDAASTLTLVSRTFIDRDAVLDALKPGTPLLWQVPPQYGQPDRYIQVGDATVARYHPDHRYQPRTITLPFVVVDRPEGPAQGICGARIGDLCDTYATWGAMTTAGLSYQDILLGLASPEGPPDPNRREWIDVENGFANWLGVETAPNTWKTLRDGE